MVRTHGTRDGSMARMVGWMGRAAVDSIPRRYLGSPGGGWAMMSLFYSCRRLIIRGIRRLARQGGEFSLAAAAEELETRRREERLSLTGLNELSPPASRSSFKPTSPAR